MEVLVTLAAANGEVVSREKLLTTVWGDTIVQEEALTQAVSQLRRLLEDNPSAPRYIETIRKGGYRLIAPVHRRNERSARRPRAGVVFLVVLAVATILVSGFFGVRALRPAGSLPAVSPALVVPLTSLPGNEREPAISPDGRTIAYAWSDPEHGGSHIHVKRIDGGEASRLTTGDGFEFSARWSPNGRRLAFAEWDSSGFHIRIVAATGGSLETVATDIPSVGGLDWSPDGLHLVLSLSDSPGGRYRLHVLDLVTREMNPLTNPGIVAAGDVHPRFSPDGRWIAFARGDRGHFQDVYVVRAQGGEPERLTHGLISVRGLTWNVSGDQLVVAAPRRGAFTLWLLDFETRSMRDLALVGTRVVQPDCARQEGGLVFCSQALDLDLVRIPLAPAGSTPPSPTISREVARSTRQETAGRFEPNGDGVLFVSDRTGQRELWLERPGEPLRQLTDFGGAEIRNPQWAPDGKRIGVSVARDGFLQLYLIDVASGSCRRLTDEDGHHRFGHWSADGHWLYFSTERDGEWLIARVHDDGSKIEPLDVPGCLTAHETAAGDLIFYKDTASGLWQWRTATNNEVLVAAPEAMAGAGVIHLVDTGFWRVRRAGDVSEVVFHDFQSGTASVRATAPPNAIAEITVNDSASEALLTVVNHSASDLAFVPGFH